MKKLLLQYFFIVMLLLVLPSCIDEEKTVVSNANVANVPYSASDIQYLSIFSDYDKVIALCNDAFEEFFRAVKQGDNADFSHCIDSDALDLYMQYRVKNHIFGYSMGTRCKFLTTEVVFHDEYALVIGRFFTYNSSIDSEASEGMATFVVKNYDGRLVITEWYWPSMHSPDEKYRNNFSVEDNLDYWENESKYSDLLAQLDIEFSGA